LPFTGTADVGFENVTLDWQGYGGMTLQDQVVAGYITDDFYVGALGLAPWSVNITSFNDQYPSLIGALKAENHIPSSSYGYTAGASYRSYPASAFGSLTLGGYDSRRMDTSKNLTVVGVPDTYRPFLVGIGKITSGPTELLDSPIITAVESIVSQAWLPISACEIFESAFGLVWDSAYKLYIVNETQHSTLLAGNASITFTLSTGSKQNKDNRLNITLPNAAFDLIAKPPFGGLNKTARYFPLKRAANETQYTLGRVLLQETYMIADYDRAALSLFPAVFPDSSAELSLVTIYPPGDMRGVTTTTTTTTVDPQGGLSRTTIVGIVVGSIILLVSVAAGVLFYTNRSRRELARKAASETSTPEEKGGLPSGQIYHKSELEGHTVQRIVEELASSEEMGDWNSSQ
jgi:hypothetical protein